MMPVTLRAMLLNMAAFQLTWLACAYGARTGLTWIGLVAAAVAVGWHLWQAGDRRTEAGSILLAAVVGLAGESALAAAGLIRHVTPSAIPGLAPLWLVGLWAVYGTLSGSSLSWLLGRPVLAAVLGAIFGPIAYLAAARVGALVLPETKTSTLAAIALLWAAATPGLLLAYRGLRGRFSGNASTA